jgi:hypothetical protein
LALQVASVAQSAASLPATGSKPWSNRERKSDPGATSESSTTPSASPGRTCMKRIAHIVPYDTP